MGDEAAFVERQTDRILEAILLGEDDFDYVGNQHDDDPKALPERTLVEAGVRQSYYTRVKSTLQRSADQVCTYLVLKFKILFRDHFEEKLKTILRCVMVIYHYY